ncbi:unnamed protein product [Ostreobium quekettii]|uniref:Nucleoside diphosphate kinase n=1 Tax=Ostreobium quekettii TaxID=121088 RepID=A0A8S1IU80_9CHLO|nr:unnamed protein product [Ostreobium quekettii]
MDAPVVASASAPVEKSYIMIKPDGVQRGLVGEVIGRFERKGFKLVGLKMFRCPRQLAEEHYGELKDRPFFPKLVDYITSGPVVCMVWEGDGVVASARKLIGKTDPLEADPGTIRGDLGLHKGRNVVHGSDSPENGLRETGEEELITEGMNVSVTANPLRLFSQSVQSPGSGSWHAKWRLQNEYQSILVYALSWEPNIYHSLSPDGMFG